MKENRIEKGYKTVKKERREDRKSRVEAAQGYADANYRGSEAYALRKDAGTRRIEAKTKFKEAKADLARARQGYKKTKARMIGLASVAGSVSGAASSSAKAKYGAQAKESSLDDWIKVINGNSQPAEGTGDSNPGDTSGSGSSTTVVPVD